MLDQPVKFNLGGYPICLINRETVWAFDQHHHLKVDQLNP